MNDGDVTNLMNASAVSTAFWGDNSTGTLQDAIALRGYLRASGFQSTSGLDPSTNALPQVWRIFLSARWDVYVDFLASEAAGGATYGADPRDAISGAVTVWLTTLPTAGSISIPNPANWQPNDPPVDIPAPVPRRYFISRPLQASTQFVSGELLEDFMDSQDSRAPAWPEQNYGGQGWPNRSAGYTHCP